MKDQCIKCKNFKECRFVSMGDKLMKGIQFVYQFATDEMPSPFTVNIGCSGFDEKVEETAMAETSEEMK